MSIKSYRVDVDFKKRIKQEAPIMTQNDTNTTLIVTVSDAGDMSPELLDEFMNITLASRLPNGNTVHALGTRIPDTTEVEFVLSNGELSEFGFVEASLQFYTLDPERFSTLKFKYEVERDLSDEFTLKEGDSVFLQELLSDTRSVVTEMETSIAEIETVIADGPVVSVNGKTGVVEGVAEQAAIDEVAAQLAEKVGGQVKLKPEEFSDEAMALVTGNGTVNVLSIPQANSVTGDKLSPDLQENLTQLIKNRIENGNFSNGESGWSRKASMVFSQVTNGGFTWARLTDFLNAPGIYRTTPYEMKAGDIYYLGFWANSDFNRTSGDNALFGYIHTSTPNSPPQTTQRHDKTKRNVIQRLSGLYTVPADGLYYAGAVTQKVNEGTFVEITGFNLINLSETFGKGNEPSLSEVESLLEKFPMKWLSGTKSLINVKEMKKELMELTDDNNSTKNELAVLKEGKYKETFVPLINSRSDITFIGDKLWAFRASDYGGIATDTGGIYIYNEDYSLNRRLLHNFGHVNTIDYREETESLIFGNGSGFYNTDGEIYIIQGGIKEWANLAEDTMLQFNALPVGSHAVKIAVGRDFGDKVNVCWGFDNFGEHNICLVMGNDNKNVSKLLLGKGSNQLESGQFIAGLPEALFNGTYKILFQYEMPEIIQVNQGAVYYNGFLYSAIGHDGLWAIKMQLKEDGTIDVVHRHERAYNPDGSEIGMASEGITIKDGIIYHGVFGSATEAKTLFTYPVF